MYRHESWIKRSLSSKELILLNCDAGEDSWDSLGQRRRLNQSKYSSEALMLKPKLQYFGHLIRRASSLEKTLMPGKTESRRRRGRQGWHGWMASPTRWIWAWTNSRRLWRTGKPGVLKFMGLQRVWGDLATKGQKQHNLITYWFVWSLFV